MQRGGVCYSTDITRSVIAACVIPVKIFNNSKIQIMPDYFKSNPKFL